MIILPLKICWFPKDLTNFLTLTKTDLLASSFDLQNQFKTSIKRKPNDPLDLFGLNLFYWGSPLKFQKKISECFNTNQQWATVKFT